RTGRLRFPSRQAARRLIRRVPERIAAQASGETRPAGVPCLPRPRIRKRRQGEMSELQASLQARQRAYGKPTERYRAPLLAHSLDNGARQSWRREALNDRGVRSWWRRWSATSEPAGSDRWRCSAEWL